MLLHPPLNPAPTPARREPGFLAGREGRRRAKTAAELSGKMIIIMTKASDDDDDGGN